MSLNLKKLAMLGLDVVGDTAYRSKKCDKEDAEGVTLFGEWNRHPQLKNVPFFHYPNERKRSTGTDFKELNLQRMKGAYIKGTLDYYAMGRRSLIIELKRRDPTLSSIEQDQINELLKAQEAGAIVCIALGWQAAIDFALEWFDEYQ